MKCLATVWPARCADRRFDVAPSKDHNGRAGRKNQRMLRSIATLTKGSTAVSRAGCAPKKAPVSVIQSGHLAGPGLSEGARLRFWTPQGTPFQTQPSRSREKNHDKPKKRRKREPRCPCARGRNGAWASWYWYLKWCRRAATSYALPRLDPRSRWPCDIGDVLKGRVRCKAAARTKTSAIATV